VKLSFAQLHCFFFKKRYVLPCLNKITLFALLSIAAPQVLSAANIDKDSDGDGLTDLQEEKLGTEAYLADTDGDGISDGVEVGENVNKPLDSDNDNRIDALDYDDDNDGLPTFLESKNDTDKDGIVDYLDSDSDSDGLADGAEAGFLNQDKNLDGIDDAFDASRPGAVDKNGDGINDNLKLPDYNNDGIADYLDPNYKKQNAVVSNASEPAGTSKATDKTIVESTSKAISESSEKNNKELVEASSKTEASEVVPNKKKTLSENTDAKEKSKVVVLPKKIQKQKVEVNRYTDTDNDGLLDSQELILGTDIMKRDTDGDKVSDAIEVGMDINSPQDSDRDGIIDALDEDDDNDGILTKFEDINKDGTAINDDTDQDGVPNYLDANDDGDSRLTKVEGGTKDSDGDGILDYLDKNDGVKDDTPKLAGNNEIPDEPEIVVLFDGDLSSLPPEENENIGTATQEIDQVIENSIENAVANGSLDKIDEDAADKQAEDKQVAKIAADTNLQKSKLKKVVLPKNTTKATKISSAEKEKGGVMQWLTSLLPD